MPRRPADPDKVKQWMTFLRNHREVVAACDFFTVPTVTFDVLYVSIGDDESRCSAQDVNSLLGKVLRLRVDQDDGIRHGRILESGRACGVCVSAQDGGRLQSVTKVSRRARVVECLPATPSGPSRPLACEQGGSRSANR